MKKSLLLLSILSLFASALQAQTPSPALVGYWHNWNDANAPYIPLDQVDSRYNVIAVAFATPAAGTTFKMEFVPDGVTKAVLTTQIQTLKGKGKKVILSLGGATAPVTLNSTAERDTFIASLNSLISAYGFDGIDIDLEGTSITVTGGTTISNPTDAKITNLIYAIKQVMSDFYAQNKKKMVLTMAPETAFMQGGKAGYGSIWGAYLPVIHALRDSLDILHVQLYNSGSMPGLDGANYSQGTADFIVAMTEMVMQGFSTTGGAFTGLPATKVAVGLPACTSAAGGGYMAPATVKSAMLYLMGKGPKPGSYTLVKSGGYPDLKGMMTWSINWDAVSTCGTANEFAKNFSDIFGNASVVNSTRAITTAFDIFPNPGSQSIAVRYSDAVDTNTPLEITDAMGRTVLSFSTPVESVNISNLSNGIYYVKLGQSVRKLVVQ